MMIKTDKSGKQVAEIAKIRKYKINMKNKKDLLKSKPLIGNAEIEEKK